MLVLGVLFLSFSLKASCGSMAARRRSPPPVLSGSVVESATSLLLLCYWFYGVESHFLFWPRPSAQRSGARIRSSLSFLSRLFGLCSESILHTPSLASARFDYD